ncbi:MAG: metallophosphoesterase family protein [Acidobacteria bacterium]|nr:metallophosphoesterase family protein [Acidobacteriota bacterium]
MRLAILSDIHDHVWRLAAVLTHVRDTDALLCCGDLCSPFIIHQLGREYPNPIHIVFGNNDADLYRISAAARKYPHVNLHGELYDGEFEGRRVAIQHFDHIARPLAASGLYDVVFFGHNHRREIGRVGATLIVNPGPVLGAAFRADGSREDVASSYAVYDTASGEVTAFQLLRAGGVAPL